MTDPPARLTDALSDRYLIERELGEGGMATVYLARDLKHNRPVALKVLKPELAAVVGAERFLAEIETTANLQHPHILPLFDSGAADGFLFYVMPYVEGETLADRLARETQLPVEEAVGIARAVAGALETAHAAGVIHRDIKPANILLSRGQPLVSDFGIALAVGAGGARLTETGLSVGTPYYMSPEQATGDQTVGPGADIYALGCVLYEMLVGEPPYVGNTAQAVLGKIIQGVPVSATAVRKSIPLHVDAALRKALERLPADRFSRAGDFARALSDPGFRHGEAAGAAAASGRSAVQRYGWPVAAVVAGAAALAGWLQRPAAPTERPVARFHIEIPGYVPASPMSLGAVAADGSAFAFLGYDEERRLRVMLKEAGDLEATVVPGLPPEDVGTLAFSPDGDWLAVATFSGRLLKVARSGGGVSVQAEVEAGVVAWLEDNSIAVAPLGRILRVSADGGVLDTIPLPDPRSRVQQITPLPADRGFLYVEVVGDGAQDLWVFDARTGESRLLREGVTGAWYGESGILILAEARRGSTPTIAAARFDLGSLQIQGPPVGLPEPIGFFLGVPNMWLSRSGTLVYRPNELDFSEFELVWVDRSGGVVPVDPGFTYSGFSTAGLRLSPEGSRVAMGMFEEEPEFSSDILVKRLPDFPATRVTFDAAAKRRPAWHPDGRSVLYVGASSSGEFALWQVRADGTSPPGPLFAEERSIFEGLWSPDGDWVVYRTDDETAGDRGDIMGFRPGVDSVAIPLVATPAEETSPAVSPDGRWIAYASSEQGGIKNIFVQPFPNVGDGKWRISSAGGIEPAWSPDWSPDGGELFFWSGMGPGDEMRAARIDTREGFVLGSVETLFPTPGGIQNDDDHRVYDVAPDGERFLMVRSLSEEDWGLILVEDFFQVAREALGG